MLGTLPISYFTTNVNMANLQAAERQHMTNAIHPRPVRGDEKPNEQLIPLYDPSGRLVLASENPEALVTGQCNVTILGQGVPARHLSTKNREPILAEDWRDQRTAAWDGLGALRTPRSQRRRPLTDRGILWYNKDAGLIPPAWDRNRCGAA